MVGARRDGSGGIDGKTAIAIIVVVIDVDFIVFFVIEYAESLLRLPTKHLVGSARRLCLADHVVAHVALEGELDVARSCCRPNSPLPVLSRYMGI